MTLLLEGLLPLPTNDPPSRAPTKYQTQLVQNDPDASKKDRVRKKSQISTPDNKQTPIGPLPSGPFLPTRLSCRTREKSLLKALSPRMRRPIWFYMALYGFIWFYMALYGFISGVPDRLIFKK